MGRTILMRRGLVIALCACMVVFAAMAQASTEANSLKVFDMDATLRDEVLRIVSTEFKAFAIGPGSIAIMDNAEGLKRADEMIRTLSNAVRSSDAQGQVRLLVSVIGATLSGTSDAGSPLPANLRPAEAELKAAFPYQTYRLLDSLPIHVTPGILGRGAALQGYGGTSVLDPCASSSGAKCIQGVSFQHAIAGEPLKVSQFRYLLRVPRQQVLQTESPDTKAAGETRENFEFVTSFQIAKGQTLVIGKLNPESAQTAYFIAVTRLGD